MSLVAEIDFRDSFKKKTNHSLVKKCMTETIKKTTLKAETECKKEAPIKTGKLRRSHSNRMLADEGQVINRAGYAVYVVHGTSRQKANNYPKRVMNRISSQQFASKTFKKELKAKGITE